MTVMAGTRFDLTVTYDYDASDELLQLCVHPLLSERRMLRRLVYAYFRRWVRPQYAMPFNEFIRSESHTDARYWARDQLRILQRGASVVPSEERPSLHSARRRCDHRRNGRTSAGRGGGVMAAGTFGPVRDGIRALMAIPPARGPGLSFKEWRRLRLTSRHSALTKRTHEAFGGA